MLEGDGNSQKITMFSWFPMQFVVIEDRLGETMEAAASVAQPPTQMLLSTSGHSLRYRLEVL